MHKVDVFKSFAYVQNDIRERFPLVPHQRFMALPPSTPARAEATAIITFRIKSQVDFFFSDKEFFIKIGFLIGKTSIVYYICIVRPLMP